MKISKTKINKLTSALNRREEAINNFRNDNVCRDDFIMSNNEVDEIIAEITDRLFINKEFKKTGIFELKLSDNEDYEFVKGRKVIFTKNVSQFVEVDTLLDILKGIEEKEKIISEIEKQVATAIKIDYKVV